MVDLTLTEERHGMRPMAHDFAANEIRPVAWEYDRDGTCQSTSVTPTS